MMASGTHAGSQGKHVGQWATGNGQCRRPSIRVHQGARRQGSLSGLAARQDKVHTLVAGYLGGRMKMASWNAAGVLREDVAISPTFATIETDMHVVNSTPCPVRETGPFPHTPTPQVAFAASAALVMEDRNLRSAQQRDRWETQARGWCASSWPITAPSRTLWDASQAHTGLEDRGHGPGTASTAPPGPSHLPRSWPVAFVQPAHPRGHRPERSSASHLPALGPLPSSFLASSENFFPPPVSPPS